ncbi:MAG TPA: PA14 domain-containing protein, partial [Humisphaera sp.]
MLGNVGIDTITVGSSASAAAVYFQNSAGIYELLGSGLTVGGTGASSLAVTGGGVVKLNDVLTLGSGAGATVSAGTLELTNAGNSLGANTFAIGGTTTTVLRGLAGTAAAANTLAFTGSGGVALSGGGTLQVDAAAGPLVVNGLTAREFGGTAYSNAYNAATPGLNNPTSNLLTTASFSTATAGNTYTFNNFTTTANLQSTNPSSAFNAAAVSYGLQLLGRFLAPVSGYYQFQTTTDDSSRVFVDGALAINNDGSHGAQLVNGAPLFLSAGFHAIEYQLLQGTGGAQFSLGVQNATGSTVVTMPATQTFVAGAALDVTATSVSVAAGQTGTLRMNLPELTTQANLGAITLGTASSLVVAGSTDPLQGYAVVRATGGTAFPTAAGSGAISVPAGVTLATGAVTGGGAGVVVAKTGAGTLLFDNSSSTGPANTLAAGTVIDVQAGVVTGLGQGPTASNPFGAATLQLGGTGGTIRLDSKLNTVGTAVATFANPIQVAQGVTGRVEALPINGSNAVNATAAASGATIISSGAVTLAANSTLVLNPYSGHNGSTTAASGATLLLTGTLSGPSSSTLVAQSVVQNYNPAATILPRALTGGQFGWTTLYANSPSFAGAVVIGAPSGTPGEGPANLQAAVPTGAAAVTPLGTGPVTINFGRLFLKNNGTAGNSAINLGNPVSVAGGVGFGAAIDVNNFSANTGNAIQIPSLAFLTGAAANPQQASVLSVTGANSYRLEVTGGTTINGPVQLDPSTASLVLTGPVTGTGGVLTKTNSGTLQLGNSTHNYGSTAVLAGVMQVTGASSSVAGPVNVIGVGTVLADSNGTTGVSPFTGTVNLRNGAVYRLDVNKPTLPTLTTTVPVGTAVPNVLGLNVATFASTVALPSGGAAANLYLGTGQTGVNYTGGTVVPNGTQYLLGGSSVSGSTLTLTGNGSAAVLADNGGATAATIGSTVYAAIGGNVSTVAFANPAAAPNTYSGGTFVAPGLTTATGFTASVTVGGGSAPFGTGTVVVGGTLTFGAAAGSAVAAGGGNQNAYVFLPGSNLNLYNGAAYTGGLSEGRWGDTAALPLNGLLTLTAPATGTTAETVGNVTFDGLSQITIGKNGSTGAALVASGLDRAAGTRGTRRLGVGTTNNA